MYKGLEDPVEKWFLEQTQKRHLCGMLHAMTQTKSLVEMSVGAHNPEKPNEQNRE
jgi:hypothetical protein